MYYLSLLATDGFDDIQGFTTDDLLTVFEVTTSCVVDWDRIHISSMSISVRIRYGKSPEMMSTRFLWRWT